MKLQGVSKDQQEALGVISNLLASFLPRVARLIRQVMYVLRKVILEEMDALLRERSERVKATLMQTQTEPDAEQ